ncbi:V-type ATP synthase subunit D [Candidatus Lokiarchaeum ossiferum]|uniref:A-type ATP synthase subunit D n=1 Tax=Candidatus Lokiarchaeum ossiferum TaxID=2951803 RepID=A0ABY6HZV3_9ARCH|nr:V-type ATP synthase subunit D [Candidatus Lokiarchaeum sp. B-35]
MSFQNVKPTKPELDRLKKKRQFSVRGENLLEIKREQLLNSLKTILDKNFSIRSEMRSEILKDMDLLEKTYETIGKRKVDRISRLNEVTLKTSVEINYIHEMGIDVPKLELHFQDKPLPSYSYGDTTLHLDILLKRLKTTLGRLIEIAEVDSMMYRLAEDNKKIQRRIDALDDIIIPQLDGNIHTIEEILNDEEREEFIRMKKIKEFLEDDEAEKKAKSD